VQDTKCLLCPPRPAERKKGSRDSAFFRAAKPTEFRGWVHILCSTFNHELEYTDAKRMRLVEGIVSIPQRNYTQACDSRRSAAESEIFARNAAVVEAVTDAYPNATNV
jgi:hypothetical protein